MNTTIKIVKRLRTKISKLESDFKRGIPPYQGFTIDISYGGNTGLDIERVCIGSVSDEEGMGEIFYKMVLDSLKNSLKYWEDVAKNELADLTLLLK